jgi:hypothetical protein
VASTNFRQHEILSIARNTGKVLTHRLILDQVDLGDVAAACALRLDALRAVPR